jgi:hypothetical protein
MENYSVIKNEITSLAGKWMELEIIILRKIIQTQKDKNHIFSLCVTLESSVKTKDMKVKGDYYVYGRVSGGEERNMIKVHYIPVWKCHNETHCFVQLLYADKRHKQEMETCTIIYKLHLKAMAANISSLIPILHEFL